MSVLVQIFPLPPILSSFLVFSRFCLSRYPHYIVYPLIVVKVSGCVAITIYSLAGWFLTLTSTTRLLLGFFSREFPYTLLILIRSNTPRALDNIWTGTRSTSALAAPAFPN
jgi:hypothetical protein